MASGTVTWFNPDKGYGFVMPDDGEGEAFVHWSGIVPTDEHGAVAGRVLSAGQRVEFVESTGPQGREVHDVVATPCCDGP